MPFCRSEGRSEISEEVEEGLEPGGGQGGRRQRGRETVRTTFRIAMKMNDHFVKRSSSQFVQSVIFYFKTKVLSRLLTQLFAILVSAIIFFPLNSVCICMQTFL